MDNSLYTIVGVNPIKTNSWIKIKIVTLVNRETNTNKSKENKCDYREGTPEVRYR